jgi:2-keto-3-deoxy-6-phosphogluconate aldolase
MEPSIKAQIIKDFIAAFALSALMGVGTVLTLDALEYETTGQCTDCLVLTYGE